MPLPHYGVGVDHLGDHRVARLGPEDYPVAEALLLAIGLHSVQQLTNGRLRKELLYSVHPFLARDDVDRALRALLRVKLLERDGRSGWRIPESDWCQHNRLRSDVDADRERLSLVRARAGRVGGRRSAEVRARARLPDSKPQATRKQTPSKRVGTVPANGSANGLLQAPLPEGESRRDDSPRVEGFSGGSGGIAASPSLPEGSSAARPDGVPEEALFDGESWWVFDNVRNTSLKVWPRSEEQAR